MSVNPTPVTAPIAPFAPRFDAPVRYGISLASVVLGAYLLVDNTYGQFISIVTFEHANAATGFLLFTQYLFAVIVLIAGLLIAPTTIVRRIVAAAIVFAVAALYAGLTPLYFLGKLPSGPSSVLPFLLQAPFLFTAAAAAGWLIVRERRGISYLFLLATIVIAIVERILVIGDATSAIPTIVANVLALVIGVGIAWAGRAVAGAPTAARA